MHTVTVILEVENTDSLEEQVLHLAKQSTVPTELWLVYQDSQIVISENIIDAFRSKFNINSYKIPSTMGRYGKFLLGNLVNSDFVYFLNPEVFPGELCLESCIDNCLKFNSIITGNGYYFEKDKEPGAKYYISRAISENNNGFNYVSANKYIDFGADSYFLKREWLDVFWRDTPHGLHYLTDIYICTTLKIRLGISTLVLKQESKNTTFNMKFFLEKETGYNWDKKEYLTSLMEAKNWKPVQYIDQIRDEFFIDFSENTTSYSSASSSINRDGSNPESPEAPSLIINYNSSAGQFFTFRSKETAEYAETQLFIDLSAKENQHLFILMKSLQEPKLTVEFLTHDEYLEVMILHHPGLTQKIPNDLEWVHFDFSFLDGQDEKTSYLLSRIRDFKFYIQQEGETSGSIEILAFYAGSIRKFEELMIDQL
jgi:hypothetical protein